MFDPWAVEAHNELAVKGKAKVVIVSNWRRWCSIEDLQDLFKRQGLDFDYADKPSCMKRGLSSNRAQDVSCHIQDYLPDGARALVIDDDEGLAWLNAFMPLEEDDISDEKDHYGNIKHDDRQVGLVEDKDIKWKWLDVDYHNGLTFNQLKIGAEFFGFDNKFYDNRGYY